MSFQVQIGWVHRLMVQQSKPVHTEKWQGVDISGKPDMAMHEVRHVMFKCPMQGEDLQVYRDQIKPNLPWADDHFEERVCGQPINPGIQWAKWPWGQNAQHFLDSNGKFNHNYMERYWPKYAGLVRQATRTEGDYLRGLKDGEFSPADALDGIYHPYGDLWDVVMQLAREPMTRQAILPVFFPEDTGAVHYGRVPCSLAYQFFMRDSKLDISYWLRSCDFYRHFRDDIYLTARLCLWVLDRLREMDKRWLEVTPGDYVMMITSLHCFRNDYLQLTKSP